MSKLFDELRERLLRDGIAPRHVRRYIAELEDHLNELRAQEDSEAAALTRLGTAEGLAKPMLDRREFRSWVARAPWAVFGIGPIAMIALSFGAAVCVEVGVIMSAPAWAPVLGITPGPAAASGFAQALLVWNMLAVYGAPLFFAWLIYRIGSRQRVPANWIMLGIALVCILGGFQILSFYDTGLPHGGRLTVDSALIPPFTHFTEGLAHVAMNLAISGGVWWLSARRKASSAPAYVNA